MQVMAANGVSHHIVEDDLAGAMAMLKWLAFVPPTLPGTLPILRSTDPIGRDIEYAPHKGKLSTYNNLQSKQQLTASASSSQVFLEKQQVKLCTHKPARCSRLGPLSFLPLVLHAPSAGEKLDARVAIGGRYICLEEPNTDATASTSGRDPTQPQQQQQQQQLYWESGLFDKDSWVEAHPGWARSVVTGRARLGGMPCGASVRHHLRVSPSLDCSGTCMLLVTNLIP